MGHSYTSCHVHYAFSTKERVKLITRDLQQRLWPHMGGIARKNGMTALAIGGTDDHAHLLVSLPATMSMAKGIQLIKAGAPKWVHDKFPSLRKFAWQEGYGGFSIGVSQVAATIAYIENQHEHHRRKPFQEEFLAFLKRHGVEYDERYVWD